MNIQQLEYIVALDTHRHFVQAADHCFVTQATLSMMVKKLEEELQTKIFDRSKQPIVPTNVGVKIIEQAKVILAEHRKLNELVNLEKKEVSGELRLGIIPTLAPYIVPLFLQNFLKKYPGVHLKIKELLTEDIIKQLEQNQIDAGLVAIPLEVEGMKEYPLFKEDFVVYSGSKNALLNKKYIPTKDINTDQLLLLEEGHCLRTQIINLCALKAIENEHKHFELTAGSIETLKNIVEVNQGITILPQLALKGLSPKQLKNTRQFQKPIPQREIGFITYRYYVKERILKALQEEILAVLPKEMHLV
jgi:LysR family hydrogen peroxide-inducible transcriptional activator